MPPDLFPSAWLWAASDSAWRNMFELALPLVEKVLRPAFVYVALVIGLRIFGKRELAQLNPFDLVVLMCLANTVQNASIGDDSTVSGGIIGAFSLLAVNYLVIRFLFKHRRLDQFLEGKPVVLIEGGRIIPEALAGELLNESELLTALHRQGFSRVADVETCVLEPGGSFNITAKEPRQPERLHAELVAKLDRLERHLEALEKQLAGR